MVLAHVYNRLSNLVSQLTVQIFKDDWTRASSYNLLAGSSFPSPFPPTSGAQRGPSPILDQSQRYKMNRPFSTDIIAQDQRTSTPIRASPSFGTNRLEPSHQGHGHSHQGHGHSHQGHGHSHWFVVWRYFIAGNDDVFKGPWSSITVKPVSESLDVNI